MVKRIPRHWGALAAHPSVSVIGRSRSDKTHCFVRFFVLCCCIKVPGVAWLCYIAVASQQSSDPCLLFWMLLAMAICQNTQMICQATCNTRAIYTSSTHSV